MRRMFAMALAAAIPAHAATLRGGTVLSGTDVRLSDLFDDVGQDRVIGPAPDPGGRIIVEAAQLGAIARQFGVEWRPASQADRIVLERPGRTLPVESAMTALRAALSAAGVPADATVEAPGFVPPLIPVEAEAQSAVGQLDYAATPGGGGGCFTAVLSVTAPGMSPAHARLSGRVTEMIELPVAARRLLPGDVIGPADIRMARLQAGTIRGEMVQTAAQAIGMAMRRLAGPGAPLPVADLARPTVVQKGETVRMEVESPGISAVAQGVAMESAAAGEHVRVLNPLSRALVEAEVLGAGRVRVSGVAPSLLPPGAAIPVRVAIR